MKLGWLWFGLLAAVAVGLAACGPKKEAAAPEPRPVRTVTAKPQNAGETVVLTGHIQAEDEASMAFRIGGRMTDRSSGSQCDGLAGWSWPAPPDA
jgi:membrane fusion protein, multidrug efflux system